MKLCQKALPGDLVDGALVVLLSHSTLGLAWPCKIILRLSLHYALALRIVPVDSDLRKYSWLARWLRLQVRLIWFPAGAPFVPRWELIACGFTQTPEEQILRARNLNPRWYTLVPDLERDGWYIRRKVLPWR